jgi:hypothetical protein
MVIYLQISTAFGINRKITSILNVHGINYVKQTDQNTAEALVTECNFVGAKKI